MFSETNSRSRTATQNAAISTTNQRSVPQTAAISDLQSIRRDKVEQLRAAGNDPYPPRAHRSHTTTAALAHFQEREATLSDGQDHDQITLVGRIVSLRHMGKTVFAHLRDGYGELQLYLRRDVLGDPAYDALLKLYDLGDFAQATGTLFRTKAGEISLRVELITMLAKALNAPPEKWHGLTDVELRYRQRYADLIANAEVRQVFQIRSAAISAIRRFLDSHGYIEVETPALQPLYGGAAARVSQVGAGKEIHPDGRRGRGAIAVEHLDQGGKRLRA